MKNRKRRYRISVVVLATLGVVIGAYCLAEEGKGNDIQKQAERIWKLQGDRGKDIRFLLDIVKDDSKIRNELRVLAVQALGDIRAEEAAPILIENVDVITPGKWTEKTATTMIPCYVALVKIGKVGSLLSLEELGKEMKDSRRYLLTRVVFEVEGYEVGAFLIEQSIDRARDKSVKENLGKSLKLIKKFKDDEIHRTGR